MIQVHTKKSSIMTLRRLPNGGWKHRTRYSSLLKEVAGPEINLQQCPRLSIYIDASMVCIIYGCCNGPWHNTRWISNNCPRTEIPTFPDSTNVALHQTYVRDTDRPKLWSRCKNVQNDLIISKNLKTVAQGTSQQSTIYVV